MWWFKIKVNSTNDHENDNKDNKKIITAGDNNVVIVKMITVIINITTMKAKIIDNKKYIDNNSIWQ